MDIKKQNTNKLNLRTLLNIVLYSACILCVSFASCTPESKKSNKTMKVQPQQENTGQISESVHSKDFDAKQIGRPNAKLTNQVEKQELMQLATFPEPKKTRNNSEPSEYIRTRKTIISVASGEQINLPGEIAARRAIITTTEEKSSESAVSLPVLDNPGMTDELICVNFDQVDIRFVLKTVGDITGINFVVDDGVSGTVTMMSPTKIRLSEVYTVFGLCSRPLAI